MASSYSVLLFVLLAHGTASADPAVPTVRRQVAEGIEYLFYGDADTPMHAVILDRSHREYELRVLADRQGGYLRGHQVDHFAQTHTPAAIVAINGGNWRCLTMPDPIRDPVQWSRCKGFLPGGEYLPTGVLSTNDDVFAEPNNGEVIFGAATASRPGSRIAIMTSEDWGAPAYQSFHHYAVGHHRLTVPGGATQEPFVLRAGDCAAPLAENDPRSAIGYGPDVIVLVSSDHHGGRRKANIPDLCWIFRLHGVTDAMLLDGGRSAQMYVEGVGAPVNSLFAPDRIVANAIGIVRVCKTPGDSCGANEQCCDGRSCIDGRCATPSTCGNGVIDSGEACDRNNLGGATCIGLGYGGGGVTCSAVCDIDSSGCCADSCPRNALRCSTNVEEQCLAASGACAVWTPTRVCASGCDGNTCSTECSCADSDNDSHYGTTCSDASCVSRDDCNDGVASIYGGAPELCDLVDNDCDSIVDDNASCWRPVYRFWHLSSPDAARPRCYGNAAAVPAACPGYTLEFTGPAYFVLNQAAPGTVEFVAFDKANGTDHMVVQASSSEAVALGAPGSGWVLRGSLGFYWPNSSQPPAANYYVPAGAGTSNVRDLRRYLNGSAGIHLFTNSPMETAPGWNFEGVRAYVWSSRW